MKLELKTIRHLPHLDRASFCYTATVWLNGKPAAYVDSDGRGGSPDISYTDPATMVLLDDYFKSQPDIETWANQALINHLKAKSRRQAHRLPRKCAADYRVVD